MSQGTTAGNPIALTFDCGADRGNAPAILDLLQRAGIVASFGVTGLWAEQNPDLVRRMVAQGDQIMDHTYDHRSFTGFSTHTDPMTAAQIADELQRTDALLRHLTGSSTRPYFRSPYGDDSPEALAAAAGAGFNVDVRWTVDSLGWEGLSAAQIVARVLDSAAPGGIILMHVGAASQDGAALARIVDGLRARGYRFVTVAGLLAADHRRGAPHPAAATSYRAVDPDAAYYPGAAGGPLSGYVVVLDPGHGGDDPGTCYPYTFNCFTPDSPSAGPVLTEKAVALDVTVYHLLPRLHLLGADVYLTRTTLEQNPDLEQRLQIGNYVGRVRGVQRHALYISLHLNGAVDPSVDYTQTLYAPRRPSRLARTLVAAFGAALQPAPAGGNRGVDTFPGHVLRHNILPATIAEPAFLTSYYPVTVPISATRIVTATSGVALRRGWQLTDPVVGVVVHARAWHGPARHTLVLRERFPGAIPLRVAITIARTNAISAFLAITTSQAISLTAAPLQAAALTAAAPSTQTAPLTPTTALTSSPPSTATAPLTATAPSTATAPLTATAPPTQTPLLAPAIPPTVTYAISVSGAISVTVAHTTLEGEGPWLVRAHAATRRLNARVYDTPAPSVLALGYGWNDREEVIARGLVQGIARFFGLRLPRDALRPRAGPVRLAEVGGEQ